MLAVRYKFASRMREFDIGYNGKNEATICRYRQTQVLKSSDQWLYQKLK